MKVIFLDIDGVTYDEAWCIKLHKEDKPKELSDKVDAYLELDHEGEIKYKAKRYFSTNVVKLLNEVIEKTGAKFVISSSHRTFGEVKDWQKIFDLAGIKGEVISRTDSLPHHDFLVRGNEIYKWVLDHSLHGNEKQFIDCPSWEYKTYVIVDDDADMLLRHKKNFVQTNPTKGITERKARMIIKILNEHD